MNVTPGIYPAISMSDYLSTPAVSASILKTLLAECPRKAWAESWLNPDFTTDYTAASDLGSIAHAVLLEGGGTDLICVIDPAQHPAEKTGAIPIGWTNKSIRAARDQARAAGKIPILADAAKEIYAMVEEANRFIASLEDSEPAIWAAFQDHNGKSEDTVIWHEKGHACKMRPDRRSNDWSLIIDYKTTERSVEPDAWARSQLVGMGYYLSAAWYRRGAIAATGKAPAYVFLAQEVTAPYLCSLVGTDPAMLEGGDRMIESALAQWDYCVRENYWPAYPNRICYPEPPAYLLAQWEEREVGDIEGRGMPPKAGKQSQWLTQREIDSGAI